MNLKKFFGPAILSLLLFSCSSKQDHYNLRFDIEGHNGQWLKLMSRINRDYVVYDSVQIEEGIEPVLSRSLDSVQTMYLTLEGEREAITLLMENADYTISGTWSEPVIKTDSKAQNDLNTYTAMMRPLNEEIGQLTREYRAASGEGNTAKTDSLLPVINALYSRKSKADSLYVMQHPDSYASVLALRDFFYEFNGNQLEAVLESLSEPVRVLQEYHYMNGKMENMQRAGIGKKYINFELPTPGGEMLSISDVHHNNVLLIDFWASWCGPCRRANPELVRIYNALHDRGFDIIGVSLDRDSTAWVNAIAHDHLDWYQISDLNYWNSKGAELYGVPAIPHTVLIDREGIIRAKKLHGAELKTKIEELLAE